MKNLIQVTCYDLHEFKSMLSTAVKTELSAISQTFKAASPEIKILTREECANLLKVSTTTLWKMDKSGELPSKRVGTSLRYIESDVINYLNNVA